VEPAHQVGQKPERGREQLAAEAVRLRFDRGDLHLVREPARPRADDFEAVALEYRFAHGERPLGGDGRRSLGEPHELRVRVREARARVAALVHERVEIALRVSLAAAAPCLGDEVELRVLELGERACVPWAVDDDLLPLERGKEVRDDAYGPGLLAFRQPQRLRWRAVLAAGAERTLVQLLPGRRLEPVPRGTRPARPRFGEGDPPPGRAVAAELAAQLSDFPLRSRKGLKRSIGAGKTIVVACDEPSSSSVWR